MTTSRISQAIHQVCGKMPRNYVELNDCQLLESFIVGREAAALEALVGRHGPMVWGVCRRILSNHHDAEDAFQAAFLVLVRKASSIKPRYMVGNWLFGVARQTALKARATTAKRRAREKQMPAELEPVAPADLSSDLSALLDNELTKLPDKYRSVLILCGLQGKPLKEAARRMDLPEGTVASRLARGRAMLAKRMVRHGLAVSGVSLAALQAHQSASAGVSTAAISSTIKAATAAGVVSANVGALTKGVLKAMLLTKLLKTTAAALVILGVLGAGVIGLAGQKPEPQPPAKPSTQQAKKDKAPEQEAEAAKDDKEKDDPDIRYQDFSVSGRAVDPDGKPVSGATIFLVSTNSSPARLLDTVITDKEGQYAFKDAKLPYRIKKKDDDAWEQGSFEVFGKCPGRAFAWGGLKILNIDPRLKVQPAKAVKTDYFPGERIEIGLEFDPPKKIEGRIVDEKGQPIAGVKLRISDCDYVNTAGKAEHVNLREFWGMNQAADVMPKEVSAVTDAKGQFEFSSVPPDVFCLIWLQHPDYAYLSLYTSTAANPPPTHDDRHPVLKLPLNLTLHSVRVIKVQVRSKEDEKPVAGVNVSSFQPRTAGYSWGGTSDKKGELTLKLPPGKYQLNADPARDSDFVRTSEDLTVAEKPAEQSFVLRQQEGCVLILKAIDVDTGKGVPKVTFFRDVVENGVTVGRAGANSDQGIVTSPVANDKGELRIVVQPGKGRYSLGLPEGYDPANGANSELVRKLELSAGKTITEVFKIRKKN
jgi:RNA polymerase sigma factor (sigma-70 family)